MNVQRTGRPSVGQAVTLESIGRREVVSNDPSLVKLKCPRGATFKIGERALEMARWPLTATT